MVALDRHARAAGERNALDHVGIKRPLREEICATDFLGFIIEHFDEGLADELALVLGIGQPLEAVHEQRLGINVDERNAEMLAEQADNLLAFAEPHQPMIDIDTGQLVADRFVDQDRCHRTIDSARKPANDASVANLLADVGNLCLSIPRHRPVAGAATDMADEIGDQLAPVGCVDNFGVEHRCIESPRIIGDHRKRRAFGGRDHAETRRQCFDLVAVAHPDLMAFAGCPQAVEEHAAFIDFQERPPEFAALDAADAPAQLRAHRLLTIADAEDGDARVEESLRCARAVAVRDRRRTAPENNPRRFQPVKRRLGRIKRRNLAIHSGFAHATGDKLSNLAAEIDDQYGGHARAAKRPALMSLSLATSEVHHPDHLAA